MRAIGRTLAIVGPTAVLATALAIGSTGFFQPQDIHTTVTLPSDVTASPVPDSPVTVAEACSQLNPTSPGPIHHYANDPETANLNFAPSLVPGVSPVDDSYGSKPSAQEAITTAWKYWCTDSEIARAVTLAAYPTWRGMYSNFNWTTALASLAQLHWSDSVMEYHAKPPTAWTMLAQPRGPNKAPTTYIARAHHAGWYLRVPIGNGHDLLLRVGCGGQPVLDLNVHGYQAPLSGMFPTY